jgi:hypothetical protein
MFTHVAAEALRLQDGKNAKKDPLTRARNFMGEARCALSTMNLSSVSLVAYMRMLDVSCLKTLATNNFIVVSFGRVKSVH